MKRRLIQIHSQPEPIGLHQKKEIAAGVGSGTTQPLTAISCKYTHMLIPLICSSFVQHLEKMVKVAVTVKSGNYSKEQKLGICDLLYFIKRLPY